MIRSLFTHLTLLLSFKHNGEGLPKSNGAGAAMLGLALLSMVLRIFIFGVPEGVSPADEIIRAFVLFALAFCILGPVGISALMLCLIAADVVIACAALLTGLNPYASEAGLPIVLCSIYPGIAFSVFWYRYRLKQ